MRKLRRIAVVLAAIMLMGMLAGCGGSASGNESESNSAGASANGTEDVTGDVTEDTSDNTGSDESGDSVLNLILITEDGTEHTYEVSFTSGSNLREALYEGGLIEEDQLAELFLVTIDGYDANYLDGVTWLIQDENREQLEGFVDEIYPEDGQTIYMEYYVVPDYD